MSTNPKTLLIVDDDEGMRDTLTAILRRDYAVSSVASGEAGIETLARASIDLMLLDVRLPKIGGLDVLKHVKEQYPHIEVIVISAVSEVEVAVQAIKQGAYHFITKDFDYDALRSLVRNASEKQDLSRRVATLAAQVADQQQGESDFVTGTSPAMKQVIDLVRKIAKTPATVLIQGESGTGKEHLARLLHRESANAGGPFIAVNLAAVPAELVESTLFGHEKGAFTGAIKQQLGKFEMAAGGTLFLDEIGDLRLDLQAKLLRALQEGEIERVGGAKPVRDGLPAHRRDQRRSRARDPGGPLPRGPVLPHQRDPDAHAAAARTGRRPRRSGGLLSPPLQHPLPQERPRGVG